MGICTAPGRERWSPGHLCLNGDGPAGLTSRSLPEYQHARNATPWYVVTSQHKPGFIGPGERYRYRSNKSACAKLFALMQREVQAGLTSEHGAESIALTNSIGAPGIDDGKPVAKPVAKPEPLTVCNGALSRFSLERLGCDPIPAPSFPSREEWLMAAAQWLAPKLLAAGGTLPEKIRFSCGWPGSGHSNVIGECWYPLASGDGHTEIFISPTQDAMEALAVLAHELCHACLPMGSGHGKEFRKIAEGIGLTGPMTATTAGEELQSHLYDVLSDLGPYPHGKMLDMPRRGELPKGGEAPEQPRGADTPKKQGTRMLKVECPKCGYTVRTTSKWLKVGVPTCPCGTLMKGPEDAPDEEE